MSPMPTRPQIEASFALPTYKVEILDASGTWHTILNARVASISGSADSTGNQDNGLSFGTPSSPTASVEIEDHILYSAYYAHDKYWINRPVRIAFGFSTSDYVVVYQGPVKSLSRKNEAVTFDLGGSLDYLANVKLHTRMYYNKAAATKTTIATIEDPTDVGYVGGLINFAFWYAGGRPYEQKDIIYTEASTGWKFWYSCEQSLIAIDFSWYSGDNTQDEVFSIARAVGGQIYQDTLGVVRYTQPLTFADTTGYSSYYTFTDSVFNGYSETISNAEAVGLLKMAFTPRRVEPVQEVIKDSKPRLFMPGETQIIELAPQAPIYEYEGLVSFASSTATNTLKALYVDNRAVTPTIGTVLSYANKVSMEITNPSSTTPMIINNITIQGRPLAVDNDIFVDFGFGTEPERVMENNIYVQNEVHATRLIRMIYDFYSVLKPIITLDNVQYDPDRFIGEIVQIDSTYNSDATKYYRIIKVAHQNIGTSMSIGLVEITDLSKRSDMFIIGDSYVSGDTRNLSY